MQIRFVFIKWEIKFVKSKNEKLMQAKNTITCWLDKLFSGLKWGLFLTADFFVHFLKIKLVNFDFIVLS